jgi:nitroreductase
MLPAQWADIGGLIQSVMVLARGHGLHTCPQQAWVTWQRTVRAFLALPEELMLFCGMALGYEDTAAAINSWRSPRQSVDDFATFSGFTD